MNPMRALALSLLALAASGAAAASHADDHFQFTMVLHENPLHVAPDVLYYEQGASISVLVGNPETNNATHTIHLEGYDVGVPMLDPGRGAWLNLTLDKVGTFSYSCTVPGHADGGMIGTLTVAGPAATGNGTPAPAALALFTGAAGAALLASRRRA